MKRSNSDPSHSWIVGKEPKTLTTCHHMTSRSDPCPHHDAIGHAGMQPSNPSKEDTQSRPWILTFSLQK